MWGIFWPVNSTVHFIHLSKSFYWHFLHLSSFSPNFEAKMWKISKNYTKRKNCLFVVIFISMLKFKWIHENEKAIRKKQYFDQRTRWAAPIAWSKIYNIEGKITSKEKKTRGNSIIEKYKDSPGMTWIRKLINWH